MSNTHIISDINDILDCTNSENYKRFLMDFENMLMLYHAHIDLTRALHPEKMKGKKNTEILKHKPSKWIDDGKYNIDYTLTTKTGESHTLKIREKE